MIKSVNIVIYSAVNQNKIREFKNLEHNEALSLLPTNGFLCLSRNNKTEHYKVVQIVKEINESIFVSNGITLTIYIFANKISTNDFYLLK